MAINPIVKTYTDSIQTLDSKLDKKWAQYQNDTIAPKSYYDYYFSGQDIMVYVEGAEDIKIPIQGLAFQVEQKKVPIYGAWSYTYDAVMRGNRIVSGSFSITTTTPGFMINLLSKAADTRVAKNPNTEISPSRYSITEGSNQTIDADNIQRYWSINPEKVTGKRRLFSSHPPFNLVIVYGLQTASISPNEGLVNRRGEYQQFMTDNALHSDINERMVESSSTGSQRLTIQNIELASAQYEFMPDGTPLGEVYTFFARDFQHKA